MDGGMAVAVLQQDSQYSPSPLLAVITDAHQTFSDLRLPATRDFFTGRDVLEFVLGEYWGSLQFTGFLNR